MSTKSTDAQLERMARELITIAKALDCSVHLDVTKYHDGTYGGTLWKVDQSAVDYDFEDNKRVNFSGFAADKRHTVSLERQDEV